MFRRIATSALIAGLAAGALAALVQFWLVVPVLIEAEAYEQGAMVHAPYAGGMESESLDSAAGHDHGTGNAGAGADHGDHDHGPPAGGASRHVMTFFATLVTYTGFALVLVAAMALAARAGQAIDAHRGVLWGLAGFAAAQLAPAAGLALELPGSAAAEIGSRQLWWTFCAAATAGGLALAVFGNGALAYGAALFLVLAPHALGAPHPAEFWGVVPPELSALFAGRALFAGALSWAALGGVAGWAWEKRPLG